MTTSAQHLHPDNKFRSRDKAFSGQKEEHGKRNQHNVKSQKKIIPVSELHVDAKNKIYIFPAEKSLWLRGGTVSWQYRFNKGLNRFSLRDRDKIQGQ